MWVDSIVAVLGAHGGVGARLDEHGEVLVSYGEGKIAPVRADLATHGIDLDQAAFYTDSAFDLPLLQAVGYPVAINPERELQRVAGQRGWPVVRWRD